MTDDTPDPTPEDHDDCGYDSKDHARALRLILAALRQDWPARDQVLEEIGDCPGCLQAVVIILAGEAAVAYLGPPEETPGGFHVSEEQREGAVGFISDILADVLDHRPSEDVL